LPFKRAKIWMKTSEKIGIRTRRTDGQDTYMSERIDFNAYQMNREAVHSNSEKRPP